MIEEFLKDLEKSCNIILEKLSTELKSIRSNRPSIELIENIKVNLYNQILTIKQLGALSLKPPRTIQINVWDKNAISAIAKAIEDSKMGFGISMEGQNIYINLPELSVERRNEFMKLAKKITEESKIQIRNKRDEIMKKVKLAEEDKKINKDDAFRAREKIQKIIDEANKKAESLLEAKIKELEM